MIAVAIGPDQDKRKETLTQIAAGEAKNVFDVPDFGHDDDAMKDALNDVYDLICGTYFTTISRYSITALNHPMVCIIVNDVQRVRKE